MAQRRSFSHVWLSAELGLLVSYKPASLIAVHILLEAYAVSHLRNLCLSILQVALLQGARESTPDMVQSALACLCCRMRAAEESSRPFANILAHRNGLAQTVDRRLVIYE